MLMNACIDKAIQDGHDVLWLGVWERNRGAIHFYEKRGFVQVGSLPFVFGDQLHTDLVMTRSIR
jgi:ribosomal protein S18 acetylase RimI-like enzyme